MNSAASHWFTEAVSLLLFVYVMLGDIVLSPSGGARVHLTWTGGVTPEPCATVQSIVYTTYI